MEVAMQELYSALVLLNITRTERPGNGREEEDRFYADAAQQSAPWRLARAAIVRCGEATLSLVQKHQKRRDRASRNQAEPKGVDCVVTGCAGDGDSTGGFSGHHHERLPERET